MEKEQKSEAVNVSSYQLGSAFAVLAIFIAVSWFVRTHEELVVSWVAKGGGWSMPLYFALGVVAVVVPPLSNFFLIPVAAAAWGVVTTGLLNVSGWGIGAIIAFYLARRFGEPLKRKFPSLGVFPYVEALVAERHPFWSVVLLRMTIPVDVLSYALGFFTKLSWRVYLSATFAGIAPFAFYFPYASRLPFRYQFILLAATTTAFLVYGYLRLRRLDTPSPGGPI
ncbi:VTT domain-containing protein [Candidatus Parcubacteria bacterium]|nr:VTT domain-containing protein [Candidatus Parcubacteria bacterium]